MILESFDDRVPVDHSSVVNSCGQTWPQVSAFLYSVTAHTHTHTHTHTHPFNGPLFRTTRVSRYQKGETNLDFTEARDSEWQWHQLGRVRICTSLLTTTPAPHHSFFIVRVPFLPPNQQRQSTEGCVDRKPAEGTFKMFGL